MKKLVKLLEIRYIVYWFQSGKVKQKTFKDAQEALNFEMEKHMAWQSEERIYSNGFQRINVGMPF